MIYLYVEDNTLESALLCSAWCRQEIIYKHEIYCDCFKVGREFQCHLALTGYNLLLTTEFG